MSTRLHLIPCFLLAFAAGCKGCRGGDEAQGSAPTSVDSLRQQQSDRARLLARLSGRKLDRDKVYPKDADGVVQCDSDANCFIIQSERCTPAVLMHTQKISGFGLNQAVQARYRVIGAEGDKCKMQRDVLAVDARVDAKMAAALTKRGQSPDDLERLESEAITSLTKKHPARIECSFASDQALEASLNLAENRYEPRHWRDACRELGGPAPRVGLPELEPQAAPPAAEAPAAPAQPEKPAAQKPAANKAAPEKAPEPKSAAAPAPKPTP